eukprot:TRINITY_DN1374_c0_g1_i2.p1 TRINITY_DN1374_c0_g1~~TRINITY_DN1374_c0_g1_i2.p1  ORF type:complete len:189 (-),score=52.79 TRINITY_DN1374_c0_g1_i2:687-1253(-)
MAMVLLTTPKFTGPSNVRTLGPDTFPSVLRENNVYHIVEFMTTWSPPCNHFAPVYADLSLEFEQPFLQFNKIDVGRHPIYAEEYEIDTSGFSTELPTLILFQNGKELGRYPPKPTEEGVKTKRHRYKASDIMKYFDMETLYAKAQVAREENRQKSIERSKKIRKQKEQEEKKFGGNGKSKGNESKKKK